MGIDYSTKLGYGIEMPSKIFDFMDDFDHMSDRIHRALLEKHGDPPDFLGSEFYDRGESEDHESWSERKEEQRAKFLDSEEGKRRAAFRKELNRTQLYKMTCGSPAYGGKGQDILCVKIYTAHLRDGAIDVGELDIDKDQAISQIVRAFELAEVEPPDAIEPSWFLGGEMW